MKIDWSTLISGFCLGTVLLCLILFITEKHTTLYRNGQVDALTGKIYYQLIVQPDSERVWKYVKK